MKDFRSKLVMFLLPLVLIATSLYGYSLRLIATYPGRVDSGTLGHDSCSFDFDGDGVNDLFLSAMNESGHRGRLYVLCGDSVLPDSACFVMSGEEAGDFFGYSIDNAGDVNDDEWDDFIIGAYMQGVSEDPSTAYIFYGGPLADSGSDVIFQGAVIRDFFGYAVAGAGDLNNDGYDDVVVGADDAEGGLGRAYFYFGGNPADTIPDIVVTGWIPHGHLGSSAAGLGDINGDGFDDVVIGAHAINAGDLSYGYAEVFLGGPELDETPDLILVGESTYSMFGWSATGLGDINGDEYNDFLIGAKRDYGTGNRAGSAYLYFGGSPPDSIPDIVYHGEDQGDSFGNSVEMIGDIDMDGYRDIAIGAYNAGHTQQGKVYIYLGSPTGPDPIADMIILGENEGDEFGMSISGTGDMNNNGLPDIAITAKKNDEVYYNAGKAYVYEIPPVGVGLGQLIPDVSAGDTLYFTINIRSRVDTATAVLLNVFIRSSSGDTIPGETRGFNVFPFETISHATELYIPPWIEPGPAFLRVTISDTTTEELDYAFADVNITDPSGIEDDSTFFQGPPVGFRLDQNSPNPFNPSTTITFYLESERIVALRIFDIRGHITRTLLSGRLESGLHRAIWDGTDDQGLPLPSGVYFCHIIVDSKPMVRKMVLAR